MPTDTEIANALDKFIDAKFALGDKTKGWDCLNTLLDFYRTFGHEFPKEIEGWTEENYPEKWNKDKDEGRRILGNLLMSLGREINPNFMRRGDLLIFSAKRIPLFPGIYLGSNHVLLVFDKGVRVEPLSFFRTVLISTRRLIE